MKKILILLLTAVLTLSLLSGCGSGENEGKIRVGVLAGPTGMGMAKVMEESTIAQTEVFSAPADASALLLNGELDICALPTNAAASLYQKTQGKILLLAVNTLGVLYVMEKGDAITSIDDLAGRTVGLSGQGATPEYALNYVLNAHGITAESSFYPTNADLVNQAQAGREEVILLPEPQVSALMNKDPAWHIALDFNGVWEQTAGQDVLMAMGCLALRSEFAQAHPEEVDAFLKEYRASTEFVNAEPKAAAELIAKHGIVASAAVAEKAIPNAHIVTVTGAEMKQKVEPFLQILFEADAKSIGGKCPDEAFYYLAG